MPKTRKTRKQKMQHDQKKVTVHDMTPSGISSPKTETPVTKQTSESTGTYSLPTAETKPQTTTTKAKDITPVVTVSSSEYGYLSNDLMRTALLTGAIVFAELLIRLFVVHS